MRQMMNCTTTIIALMIFAATDIVSAQICDTIQLQKLKASDGSAVDNYAISLGVCGEWAVIGAELDDVNGGNSGSAYMYQRVSGVWTEQQMITAPDGAANDSFAFDVAIDGDTVVIGAPADDDGGSDSGSSYVFVEVGGVWQFQQKLTATDPATGDFFGAAVSIDGDTIVVGAYADDDGGASSGSAYVFTRTAGVWSQQQKIIADDDAANDEFGRDVGVSGDLAVVGAHFDDDGASNAGSAYIFARSVGVWSQQDKITAGDFGADDEFGRVVAIDGTTALIGAWRDDDAGTNSGSAFVFVDAGGGNWTEQAKLTANDAAASDEFGFSVVLFGDVAAIGADRDDDGGSSSGSAYVFARTGTDWEQQTKLTADDASVGDLFGNAVTLDGDTVIVGAVWDDDLGTNSGAAYVFKIDCGSPAEGACCVAGSCASLRQSQCETLGGVFHGVDSACADVTCDPDCLADIASSAGTEPDGVVDVFDLFKLLGDWGDCP